MNVLLRLYELGLAGLHLERLVPILKEHGLMFVSIVEIAIRLPKTGSKSRLLLFAACMHALFSVLNLNFLFTIYLQRCNQLG